MDDDSHPGNVREFSSLLRGGQAQGGFVSFTNFVLEFSARSEPNANSGVFFHTDYLAPNAQRDLANGYEVQLNSSEKEKRKTGSLYAVVDLAKSPANESEWFRVRISVQGKHILVQLNDQTVVDYVEPANVRRRRSGLAASSTRGVGPSRFKAMIPAARFYFKDIRLKCPPKNAQLGMPLPPGTANARAAVEGGTAGARAGRRTRLPPPIPNWLDMDDCIDHCRRSSSSDGGDVPVANRSASAR